ncbi:MAG TPA: threonine/serine exporter family protein [Symbiobacteriaceae bacterium]|nr:threonine/serine exporter family protein [Symbiobacteriaceae bacterium]
MLSYLFAFVTSAAIAVSFRGRLRAVPASGLAGLLGWAGYDLTLRFGLPQMLAAFVGALTLGIAGELLARRLREPALMFVVPALFPLVPGLIAYEGMLSLARQDLGDAARELTRAAFYAGALAAGLSLPPAILRRR